MFELFTMGTNCVVFGVRRVQNMIQQIQLLRGVLPGVQYQQKVTFFFSSSGSFLGQEVYEGMKTVFF